MVQIIRAPSAAGAAVAARPAYISGNWYLPSAAPLATGGAMAKDVARFIPFMCLADVTISTLGVRITTVGTSNFQLAIYANQQKAGEGPRPANVLNSTGNIVNTGTGSLNGALGANVACAAGTLYWLGINNNDAAAAMVCVALSSTAPVLGSLAGSSSQSTNLGSTPTLVNAITTPLTFGTWGDLTSATWTQLTGSTAYAAIQFLVA